MIWRGHRQSLEPQYKIWSEKNRVADDTGCFEVKNQRLVVVFVGFFCTKWEDSISNLHCIDAGRQDALEKDVTKEVMQWQRLTVGNLSPALEVRGSKRLHRSRTRSLGASMVHHQEMLSLVLMPS